MKALMLNGSTRKNGCTYLALSEIAKVLNAEGVETEMIQMGGSPIRDCIGCNGCAAKGQCVFGDDMANEVIAKAKEADGFVFGSPVYYAHPSGQVLSLLDTMGISAFSRYLFSTSKEAVVPARRAVTTAAPGLWVKALPPA